MTDKTNQIKIFLCRIKDKCVRGCGFITIIDSANLFCAPASINTTLSFKLLFFCCLYVPFSNKWHYTCRSAYSEEKEKRRRRSATLLPNKSTEYNSSTAANHLLLPLRSHLFNPPADLPTPALIYMCQGKVTNSTY